MHLFQRAAYLLMIALSASLIAGCGGKPEPEKKSTVPPPPPPPTPEEIATKIVAELGLGQPLPTAGSRFGTEASQSFLDIVRRDKNKQSASVEGKRALQMVSSKLDQRIHALEENQLWEHVLAHIEAHKILNKGSSKWDTTEEVAVAELTKPQVSIVGFFYDGNTDTNAAILDFYLPITKENHRQNVRVGEEFYGLKLLQIIGNSHGVTLEYGQTGQAYDILTDSAR